ncbi:MAG: imidazolonepropionase [Muribaculaceae bacterium]|mgnify:CR=1 FL=1|nr:imidazolonepropionase [Muribaculaceae bacterium]
MLIKNIGCLTGILPQEVERLRGEEMNRLQSIENAWLLTDGERIAGFGPMESCPDANGEVMDAMGGIVTPAFCDSHTHIVWAGDRSGEFIDKIDGLSYEEIAERGGGILNSSDLLNATSEDELFHSALRRLRQMAALGTGAVEIKTGYGLTLEGELKMLRVIKRLQREMPQVEIRSTFLGAHAVGRAYAGRQGEYVDHVIADMLPAMAGEADFVDVFCDKGFFTVEETDRILAAAKPLGLCPKIHANELDCSGGVQVGVKHGALSVDHLERIGDEEIALLANSDTIATMLPGASFFSGLPYGPAKRAIAGGCAVALASDYNPGSSPSGSMGMVMSLGCIKMKLRPEQALNAVTINGAAAMGLSSDFGSITPGKYASLIIYAPWVPTLAYIPYAYTEPKISTVILKGKALAQ